MMDFTHQFEIYYGILCRMLKHVVFVLTSAYQHHHEVTSGNRIS